MPELAPYKITLAVGVIGLLVSFGRACTHGRLSVGRPQVYYLLALTIVISLSVLWADRWFGGALDAFQDFGVSLTTFFLVIWNVDTLKKLYVVIGLMVILSLFLSIQGIAAFHYGYKKEQLIIADVPEENSDEDPETAAPVLRIRGFGIMNDPNDLALGLMTSLPLLMLAWRKKVLRIVITTAVAATLSYGIYLTHSRGAALSVLVIVFTAAMPRMGKIKSAFATLLLASALLAANISG
ncbi:MAG TPA: hypothetical protein VKY31_07180, partial [Terriglobia bacterium]|nr:hypothetical protein [Terriglobia bacterium]